MRSFVPSALLLIFVCFQDKPIWKLRTERQFPDIDNHLSLKPQHNATYSWFQPSETKRSTNISNAHYSPKYTTISALQKQYEFVKYFSEGKSSAKVVLIYEKETQKHYVLKMFEKMEHHHIRFNETQLFRELFISLRLNELRKEHQGFESNAEIYDYGIVSNKQNEYAPYYIMQYVEGITLKHYIQQNIINRNGINNSSQIKSILFQILYFLSIAHKNEAFVHQDLHFNNIQITDTLHNHRIISDNDIYYMNGPKIMIFDYGYSTINGLELALPGTDEWNITEKGRPEFRKSICIKHYGNVIDDTHFEWRENGKSEIISKHSCLMDEMCVQLSGLMSSFLCKHEHVFNINRNVQKYIMDQTINYDLKYWLLYFEMLNANSQEQFIKCNTFDACLKSQYFDELRNEY